MYALLLAPLLVDRIDLHGSIRNENDGVGALEGVAAYLWRCGVQDVHLGQCLTLLEGRTAKFLDGDGQLDFLELEAALEGIAADGLKTVGEDG